MLYIVCLHALLLLHCRRVYNLSAAGSQLVAYVPLTIQTDEQTGARVAFQARMPYRAAAASWGRRAARLAPVTGDAAF